MTAHQRLVRELRAKLPDPLLKEKRKLARISTKRESNRFLTTLPRT
jgi:hypothetical protein